MVTAVPTYMGGDLNPPSIEPKGTTPLLTQAGEVPFAFRRSIHDFIQVRFLLIFLPYPLPFFFQNQKTKG